MNDTKKTGQRLLLAEDSPTNKMLATAILREAGYQVTAVSNGRELLEALRAATYDLVIMDIFMPEMDGIEATETIRALPGQIGKVPIIAMTAYSLDSDKESCLKAGMNDYISKPIQKQEMLSTVHRWLEAADDKGEAATPEHVESPVIIDERVLEGLERDTSPEIRRELAQSFLTEAASRMDRVTRAAAENDLSTMEREALALKAAAGTFGAVQLTGYATALEQACLSRDADRAATIVRNLPKAALLACKAVAERFL